MEKFVLKTPAEFNLIPLNNTTTTVNSNLKSPSNFSKVESVKESLSKQEMKKPSDFTISNKPNIKEMQSKPQQVVKLENSALDFPVRKTSFVKSFETEKFVSRFDEESYKESISALREELDVKDSKLKRLNLDLLKSEQEYKSKLNNMTKKLDEAEFQCQILAAEHSSKDSKYFDEVKSVYEKYITLQQQVDSEKSNLASKIHCLEEELSHFRAENRVLNELLGQSNFKIDVLKEELSKIHGNHSETLVNLHKKQDEDETKIIHLEKEIGEINSTKAKLLEQIEDLGSKLLGKEKLTSELKSEIDENAMVVASKEGEIAKLQKKIKVISKEYKDLEGKTKDLHNKLEIETECKQLASLENLKLENEVHKLNQLSDNSSYELAIKAKHLMELETTCQSLQSSNKQLTLRLDALNNMFSMQEKEIGTSKTNHSTKLICLWRQKVYQLLVQLKSKELEEF